MPPKVGDIVFAKTFDVYSEETQVRPGIVTKVFTEADGEFAKDREIVAITLFGGAAGVEHVDMDKGVADGNGEWVAGGWSTSEDGPSNSSGEATPIHDSIPTSTPVTPTDTTIGAVGTSSDAPASDPTATGGASTSTVGDGSTTAPTSQPV